MYIFSGTTHRGPERVQTRFWVEGGVNGGVIEKIWLSGEERLFRRSRVTSEALKRRDNGVLSRKTESFMKSKGYSNPTNKNQETAVKGGASNHLTTRAKKCNFLVVSIPLAALIFKHLPWLKRLDMRGSQLLKAFSKSLDRFWVLFPRGV